MIVSIGVVPPQCLSSDFRVPLLVPGIFLHLAKEVLRNKQTKKKPGGRVQRRGTNISAVWHHPSTERTGVFTGRLLSLIALLMPCQGLCFAAANEKQPWGLPRLQRPCQNSFSSIVSQSSVLEVGHLKETQGRHPDRNKSQACNCSSWLRHAFTWPQVRRECSAIRIPLHAFAVNAEILISHLSNTVQANRYSNLFLKYTPSDPSLSITLYSTGLQWAGNYPGKHTGTGRGSTGWDTSSSHGTQSYANGNIKAPF